MNHEQLQGIKWLLQPQTAKTVWDFERLYRSVDFNMPVACRAFFEQSKIHTIVDRSWNIDRGSVLFFCNHTTALDGFGLSLACPEELELKRVIFAISGLLLGREFCKRNILVYPKGSYRNLWRQNSGLWNRLIYFATHRWGPFAKKHTAVRAICKSLFHGASVSILPSGVIGEARWRSGIGAVLLESPPLNIENMPVFAAPVYLDWDCSEHFLKIESPGLIRFDTLRRQAGRLSTRDEIAKWLQRRYEARSWIYDSVSAG